MLCPPVASNYTGYLAVRQSHEGVFPEGSGGYHFGPCHHRVQLRNTIDGCFVEGGPRVPKLW